MISIGFIALDEQENPRFSPASSRWYEKSTNRKGPIKIYQTKKRAEGISPVGKAEEVFIEQHKEE